MSRSGGKSLYSWENSSNAIRFFFREKSCMIKMTLVFGVRHFWFFGSRMWCDKCRIPKSTIIPKQVITIEPNEKY